MFLPLLVPDTTPEATVQAFVAAFNARDAAAMARQVVGAPLGPLVFPPNVPTLRVTPGNAKVSGGDATLTVRVVLSGGYSKNPEVLSETVTLRNVEGDWRIVPLDPKAIENDLPRPLAGLALLSLHPEMANLPRPATLQTQSLSKVKQIALAVLVYAADHQDRLPPAKGLKAAVMPYLRDADVLTPPGAPKGTVGYFLDPRLSGRLSASIERPAETAMILEGAPTKTAFPYRGRTPVGYADGHAKMADVPAVLKARTIRLG